MAEIKENVETFLYSWHVDDSSSKIYAYGLNDKNENVALIIPDFKPYIWVQLPEVKSFIWDKTIAGLLVSSINSMSDKNDHIINFYFGKKYNLYYVSLDNNKKRKKYPYVQLFFKNSFAIKNFCAKISREISIPGFSPMLLKAHENNSSAVLQLTSNARIKVTGWVSFKGIEQQEKETHAVHEYSLSWKSLSDLPNKTVVPKPLLLSFDIEVNSTVETRMPTWSEPEDKIFQLSCVIMRQGDNIDTAKKILISFGNPKPSIVGKDVEIISCGKSEIKLYDAFEKIIHKYQPNIIMGYNIFGFDIPFMLDRAAKHLNHTFTYGKMQYTALSKLGMREGVPGRELEIKWSSSARKNQKFRLVDIEGRILVDFLPIARAEYTLSNYDLDSVATYLFKGKHNKDPLTHKVLFYCYRAGIKGGDFGAKAFGLVGKYCIKDSELVLRLFEKSTRWFALVEMSKVTNVPIFQLITQGTQIRVFSQAYYLCTKLDYVVQKGVYEIKKDDHYVGATVLPPKPGIYDKVVPFDFNSLYPTTIIAYNMCWSTAVDPEDTSIADSDCHIMKWEDHIGCDHDPNVIKKKQLTTDIVKIEEYLKELRTFVKTLGSGKAKQAERDIIKAKIAAYVEKARPLRQARAALKKPKYVICAKRSFKWLKEPLGILPSLLKNLLDTRSQTKKLIEELKGKMEQMPEKEKQEAAIYLDVLDQRQNALKLCANSGYGATGARKGYLPFMPVAMCTTYMGRKAIEKAAESIHTEHKGTIVYGDTDSNYVSFPHLSTAAECWDYAVEVAAKVSKLFLRPMKLAYEEKIYWRFLILTKKRYVCLPCGKDGTCDEKKLIEKGVILKRRDTANYLRTVYKTIVNMGFYKKPNTEIIDYFTDETKKLMSGAYPYTEFTITKSIQDIGDLVPREFIDEKTEKIGYKVGDYKIRKLLPEDEEEREEEMKRVEATTPEEYYLLQLNAVVQLAEKMRKRGQIVPAGSRLEYVITDMGGHNAKQSVKVESVEYYRRHLSALKIDYLYYLHLQTKSLDEVINVLHGFPINIVEKQYKYRLTYHKVLLQLLSLFSAKITIE